MDLNVLQSLSASQSGITRMITYNVITSIFLTRFWFLFFARVGGRFACNFQQGKGVTCPKKMFYHNHFRPVIEEHVTKQAVELPFLEKKLEIKENLLIKMHKKWKISKNFRVLIIKNTYVQNNQFLDWKYQDHIEIDWFNRIKFLLEVENPTPFESRRPSKLEYV